LISFNVELDEKAIRHVFGEIPALAQGDFIKNQASFSEYYEGYGFYGTLQSVTTDESYAVKLASTATLKVSGTPVMLPKTVTLASGWTWLPCPYQDSTSLADGAPTFDYPAGAMLKSQMRFANFYDGYGWFGTLTTFEPGKGYKLNVASGGAAIFES